jgi:3-phenylpropionate/trans-cinnamate dioxygenase ferredoxin subunit
VGELIRVAGVDELPDGQVRLLPPDQTGTGDGIAVFHEGGSYYALDGFIEDGAVECPLHSACFELSTGRALCLPAVRPVRTHPVEVRDGAIWVRPQIG